MELKITSNRRVESFDADLHNKLKISSIFNYMQDIAAKHADLLDVGYDALQTNRIYWVLSWAKVEIKGILPSYGEEVCIETWAKGKHRLYYMRDFIIRNKEGDVIATATSAWLLLNAETKGLTDLTRIGLELPSFPDEHAIKEFPGKFNFATDEEQIFNRKILYSDIDINKHVNNSRYIEFILDCYNQKEHEEGQIQSITMAYKGETHFMDEISINRAALNENKSDDFLKASRKEDSKEIFNCLIRWDR